MRISIRTILTAGLVLLLAHSGLARPSGSLKYRIVRTENPDAHGSWLAIPFGFPSDSMGTTFGVGGITRGYVQEQVGAGLALFGSADDAKGSLFSIWDFRVPGLDRMYLSFIGSLGDYPRQRAYANYPGDFTGAKAGSNDSSPDDYVEDDGSHNWLNLKMEYVLPIGSASEIPFITYQLRNGILVSEPSGGRAWNPLTCGVTVLMLQQRFDYQSYQTDIGEIDGKVKPVDLALLYNNTDFAPNPSFGSSQYLSLTHDFYDSEQNGTWSFIEFEASKYFSLDDSDFALQRVIALNMWTGYSPEWNEETDADGVTRIDNKTPFSEGARLGGFYRMRGYPVDRFNDRAVVYATAEYRYTLRWNPLRDIEWIDFLEPDWLQLVASVEGGQVAGDYSMSALFDDWKFCGGVGIRFMLSGTVFRFDIGVSDESTSGWAMVGHPF